jgi:hypothetical protein
MLEKPQKLMLCLAGWLAGYLEIVLLAILSFSPLLCYSVCSSCMVGRAL